MAMVERNLQMMGLLTKAISPLTTGLAPQHPQQRAGQALVEGEVGEGVPEEEEEVEDKDPQEVSLPKFHCLMIGIINIMKFFNLLRNKNCYC